MNVEHNRPWFDTKEQESVAKVIESAWVAQGGEVECFENEVAQYLGLEPGHTVAVSSGTAALYLALWVLGGRNKRVGMPSYTCVSLRHATRMIGGREIIYDTRSDLPIIDIDSINSGHGVDIDILIVPHMFGIPVDLRGYDKSMVIEDCAQAIGANVSGIPVGLQKEIGIFSFSATKLITTGGQGGMLASKDIELIREINDYREFDMRSDNNSRFNFQMTDLQASIGRVQLKKLDAFLSRREAIFSRYDKLVPLLKHDHSDTTVRSVRYRAIAECEDPLSLKNEFKLHGINTILPYHDWELLGDTDLMPNALSHSRKLLSVPLYPALTNEEVDYVCSVCRNILS